MKKTAIALAGAVALAGAAALPAAASPAQKVDVCHAETDGTWTLLNVSGNAVDALLARGDALPGTAVDGGTIEVADGSCTVVPDVVGPTVTEGYTPLDKFGAARWKGQNSGKELYVGPMTDSSALPRTEAEYGKLADGSHPVSLAYDAAAGTLTATVGATTATYDFASGASATCAASDVDTMDILVRDGRGDAGLAFTGVAVNGAPIGDFGVIDEGGTSWRNWTVTGVPFDEGFTVTGNLEVQNFVGNEGMKLEVGVGCATA